MSSSRIIHGIIGASTAGLVLVNTLPNVFPGAILKRYNVPGNMELPAHVKVIFDEVVKKTDLKYPEKVKLFISNGFSSFSLGSTLFPGGAVIGLSRTFLYNNTEELQNSGMAFKGKRLNWEAKAGEKLSEAMVFNEDELRFTLAHELSHVKNWDFTTNCFLPAWWLYFTYRAVPILANSLPPVNPVVKFTLQTCVWLASYAIYCQENKKLHHKREFVADSTAAMVGLEYVKGGISATLKRLKMNSIFRGLNGEEGLKLYSVEGNDMKDWAHPKLTERLRKLEEIYVEHYLQDTSE